MCTYKTETKILLQFISSNINHSMYVNMWCNEISMYTPPMGANYTHIDTLLWKNHTISNTINHKISFIEIEIVYA